MRHVLAVDARAVPLLPSWLAVGRLLTALVAYIQRGRRPKMRDPPHGVKVQVWSLHRRKGLLAVRPAHLGLVRLHLWLEGVPRHTGVLREDMRRHAAAPTVVDLRIRAGVVECMPVRAVLLILVQERVLCSVRLRGLGVHGPRPA